MVVATRTNLIAGVCHDAHRAYCLAIGVHPAHVYPAWDDPALPEAVRDSVRRGVQLVLDGVAPDERPGIGRWSNVLFSAIVKALA